jgi:uncharacterized repeat protein (TIGR03803 family)
MDTAGNIYGATFAGGNSYGTVFKLSPTGTGWTETVLYAFCAQTNCTDGATPVGGLIMDTAGNLYGTTYAGGSSSVSDGTVFKLAPSITGWTETVLYIFCSQTGCADGAKPDAPVVMDGAGNLYGTTTAGGSGYGTAFKLTPSSTGGPRPCFTVSARGSIALMAQALQAA